MSSEQKHHPEIQILLDHVNRACEDVEHELTTCTPRELSFLHGKQAALHDLRSNIIAFAIDYEDMPISVFDESWSDALYWGNVARQSIAEGLRSGQLLDYSLGELAGTETITGCVDNARWACAEKHIEQYISEGADKEEGEETSPISDLHAMAIACNGLNAMYGYEQGDCIRAFCKYKNKHYPELVLDDTEMAYIKGLLQIEHPWDEQLLKDLLSRGE